MQPLRRIFLASASGLERCLERELQSLRIPGRLETTSGGVLVTGMNESLWRATLQSRVADSVQLCLGEPFHAPDVRTLDAGLRDLPWEDCLRLGGREAPVLRVSARRSRLYHTRLVEERVHAALAERGRCEGAEEAPARPGSRAGAPQVSVRLRYDACHVAVAASGPLQRRGYRTGLGESLLRETQAAACIAASPLLRRLAAAAAVGEELVLWDPFCSSGVVLLEALGMVLGQPPGDRARKYPFASFPCHAKSEYEDFLNGLQPAPHSALPGLTILGTDAAVSEVELAQRNLRRLQRRLWRGEEQSADAPQGSSEGAGSSPSPLACSVQFAQGSPGKSLHRLAGRPTLLLTSLLRAGGGPERRQLGRLLRRQQADWRGVFCVATDAEDLRQQTGLEWSTELRFLSGGRWVELLQWTGRAGLGGPSTTHARHRAGT